MYIRILLSYTSIKTPETRTTKKIQQVVTQRRKLFILVIPSLFIETVLVLTIT